MSEQVQLATLSKFDSERVHSARLNGFAICEPVADATGKLLELLNRVDDGTVYLRSLRIPKTIESEKIPWQLAKIRLTIAESCMLAPANVLLHRDTQDAYKFYFLAPRSCRVGVQVTQADSSTNHRLLELVLETLLLRRSALFKDGMHAAIGPEGRAARLYLNISSRVSARTKRRHLDCLLLDLVVDSRGHLTVDTRRRCFSVPVDAVAPASSITPFAIGESIARLSLIDHENARREDARKAPSRNAIKDISFEIGKVRSTRWFAIEQAVGMVGAILEEAGVKVDELVFTATHYINRPFIKPDQLAIPDRLSIAFADSLAPTDLNKKLLETHILSGFGSKASNMRIDWMAYSKIDAERDLASDRAYLMINQAAVDESFSALEMPPGEAARGEPGDDHVASCLLRGQPTEPEEAYLAILSGKATIDEVDFYTRIKYLHHVARRTCPACFQGVDVIGSIGELPGSHKLDKVLAEIALKWALTQGKVTLASPLPPMRVRSFYTRAARGGRRPGLEAVACVDMRIDEPGVDATLTARRVPSIDKIQIADVVRTHPLLRRGRDHEVLPSRKANFVRTGLRDATFVMELLSSEGDSDENADCLVIYDGSTVRIPRIVGSVKRPPLHACLETMIAELPSGQKSLPRTKAANLLPYYISGFDEQVGREYVFIESRNPNFLRYFVPSAQPMAASLGFSRFYDIMLYRKQDHQRQNPIPVTVDHPLVRAFFSMMTQDVVRLGENGKHTLIRKLAGLALLN